MNSSPVVPSEVGWQFVPQYYTFVNKQPHRLHCFYTKASTFIHGTEGEDGKPCHGQQEIHNKITSIGFQDCKVFIHSVDAQSSANGGIIIQVIGEMSNHNEPWRKFVQTFFLAEQPNGYFVLNDIFRFLKEETVESDDGADADEAAHAHHVSQEPVNVSAPVPASPVQQVYEPVVPMTREREPTPPPSAPSPVPAVVPLTPPPVEEAPTTDVPELPTIVQTLTPAPDPLPPTIAATQPPQPNGIHPVSEPEKPAVPVPVVEKSPTPAPPSPAPVPAAAAAPPPAAPPAQPTPPVSTPAPAAPRSWASLAASNPRKWGSAVAQESRGTSEIPVGTNPGANANANTGSAPGTQTPPRAPPHHHPHQHQHQHQGSMGAQGQGPHPNYVAAQNVTVPQCFIKGVTEPISQTMLTNYLTQRFGAVKDVEIVRSKACAFLEFLSIDAARRAITASLPQPHGGEGGLWIEVGGEAVRISVEMKKERGDRPVSRPRGGAPVGVGVNGDAVGAGSGAGRGGGGGFRGRGGMRGRGGGGGGSAGK